MPAVTGRRPGKRSDVAAAIAAALVLLALHLDFWRAGRPAVWFGWVPEELLWRLAWMGLAWLYLLWFCARVWREEEE